MSETLPHPHAQDAPASGHRGEQRQRILNAAMTCFARDGFHGASMQKICGEAGMSPGALYRYFPSKEAIIAAIVEDERSARLHLLDEIARAPSILDGLTQCLELLLREPTLPTVKLGPEIMAEAIRNEKLREVVEACEDETRQQFMDALKLAVDRGEIDPALALDDVMVTLQSLADGLILHHQLHPEWAVADRVPQVGLLVRRMLAPKPREV